MAELKKMQEYEYDLPELVDQPEQQMPDSSSNQEIILPQSPAKRLKQISALEKIAVASVAIAIVALCVLTVAAAESAIGLAILVVFYRLRGGISLDLINLLKG